MGKEAKRMMPRKRKAKTIPPGLQLAELWELAVTLGEEHEIGAMEKTEEWIKLGARGDEMGEDWNSASALHWCAQGGRLDALERMLQAGARVTVANAEGETPLHWAATRSVETVEWLLSKGAPVNQKSGGGASALHWATKLKEPKEAAAMVKKLVAAGAELESRDEQGQTALHWAAAEGNVASIEALLSAGSEIGARDELGQSPALMAFMTVASGAEVGLMLLERGAPLEWEGKGALALSLEMAKWSSENLRRLRRVVGPMSAQSAPKAIKALERRLAWGDEQTVKATLDWIREDMGEQARKMAVVALATLVEGNNGIKTSEWLRGEAKAIWEAADLEKESKPASPRAAGRKAGL